MEAEKATNPEQFTPVKSVLKGTTVKTKRPKRAWSSGLFMFFGILMVVSGGMISVTVGGVVSRITFMLGLALFTLALLIKTINLAMLIYYERHE